MILHFLFFQTFFYVPVCVPEPVPEFVVDLILISGTHTGTFLGVRLQLERGLWYKGVVIEVHLFAWHSCTLKILNRSGASVGSAGSRKINGESVSSSAYFLCWPLPFFCIFVKSA